MKISNFSSAVIMEKKDFIDKFYTDSIPDNSDGPHCFVEEDLTDRLKISIEVNNKFITYVVEGFRNCSQSIAIDRENDKIRIPYSTSVIASIMVAKYMVEKEGYRLPSKETNKKRRTRKNTKED